MNIKILIALIVLIGLGAGGFFVYQNILKETIPQPPSGTVSVYKGFWMPVAFMSDTEHTMSDVNALKDVGANIVALGPTVKINSKGGVMLDYPYTTLTSFENRLKELAERYYSAGIRIYLVIETLYVEDFSQRTPPTGPPPFPDNAADIPGFFDKYNALVGQIAELAEKYKVEIFSPMNEPDWKLGAAGAGKWGKEVLPTVKANYSGKILFKNAFASAETGQIDFSGYDIIGCDPTPGGGPDALIEYRIELREMIGNMQSWAQRDNIPEIMFTEFGVWGGALDLSEANKTLAHRIVFEEGQGKVKGFIALDPPSGLDRPLKGTQTLEEIKIWFKEKLE